MRKIALLSFILLIISSSKSASAQVKSSSVTDRVIDSALLSKINALYEPYRKKLAASLEKNTTYQAYIKDFQSLPKMTSLAEYRKAKTAFNLKYSTFKKEQFAKAGIPVNELRQKISELLPPTKYQYTFGPYLSIQLVLQAEKIIPTGTGCQQFTCPYDSKLQESQGEAGAAADECPVNGSTLRSTAAQFLVVGSSNGLAKASAGKKITVPAGISAVEMMAQVDYDFFASLLTFLGGGYAKTTLGFRLTGERLDEDFSLFSRELVAGVFFDDELDLTENNFELSKTFRPLSVGGTYNIRVMAKTYSEGGGNAATAALSFINNIDFLKVCFRK